MTAGVPERNRIDRKPGPDRLYREATLMGLGGCIILIAVGAILTFATDWDMQGVNLDLVGVIFMVVGLIGVATFSSIARRRRVMVPPTTQVVEDRSHQPRDGYSNGYGA
ncbi:membrane protein [Streptomyces parvulus]|nr:membrane protein [Streptomyces parvulus]